MLDLALSALAAAYLLTAWRHGSLFATLRAKLQVQPGKLAELLLCPLCLVFYLALALNFLVFLGDHLLPEPFAALTRVIVLESPAVAGSGYALYLAGRQLAKLE